jgi:hypothetical protein
MVQAASFCWASSQPAAVPPTSSSADWSLTFDEEFGDAKKIIKDLKT